MEVLPQFVYTIYKMSNYDEQKAQALQLAKEIRYSGLSGKFIYEQWQHNQTWVAAMSYLTYKEIDNLVQSVAAMRDPSSISDEQSKVFACCKEMLEMKGMLVGVDELRKRNVQASRQFKLQICELAREKAQDRLKMLGFQFVRSPQPITEKVMHYRSLLRAQQKTQLQSTEIAKKPSRGSSFCTYAMKIITCLRKTMKIILKKFSFQEKQGNDDKQHPWATQESELKLI